MRHVNAVEAERLMKAPQTFVLDVRTPLEFRNGALKRATLISVAELPNRLDELPQEKEAVILVYCAHGVRSVYAAKILEEHGYTNVNNLVGGIAALT